MPRKLKRPIRVGDDEEGNARKMFAGSLEQAGEAEKNSAASPSFFFLKPPRHPVCLDHLDQAAVAIYRFESVLLPSRIVNTLFSLS